MGLGSHRISASEACERANVVVLAPPMDCLSAPFAQRWTGATMDQETMAVTQDVEATPPEDVTGVKVLVVDDQAPFRRAANMVLMITDGFDVVGEAESGEDAVEAAQTLRPDLVLMDINMPGINGVEATRRIVAALPDTIVVLLSTYNADDLPSDARTSGAIAYVHKEEFAPNLLEDIWAHRLDGGWVSI
jgi:two-component system invasion response regulator UvrY